MKPFVLAIISDLHVGAKARASDFCPVENCSHNHFEEHYRKAFADFLATKNKVRAEFLIVTGDITNEANPQEFELASELILEMAKALEVRESNIIIIPGNHDVDWKVLKLDELKVTDVRWKQRYDPLLQPTLIFSKVIKGGVPPSLTSAPFFTIWNRPNLLAVGYNSASHDNPREEVHHGFIDPAHIKQLERELQKCTLDPEQLRLFLIHHHPVQYDEPIAEDKDFSFLVNSEKLLELLATHKFDLVIHGHKHVPKFRTQITNGGFPLAVLGAGSFSAELNGRWSGYVNNQFHLIRIAGRSENERNVRGTIENWTYLCGSGWQESEAHNGMQHKVPFGSYLLPAALEEELRKRLTEAFSHGLVIELGSLSNSDDYLRYVALDRIKESLENLKDQMAFRIFGADRGVFDDIHLVKTE